MGKQCLMAIVDDAMDLALEGDCEASLVKYLEAWEQAPNKDKWKALCSYSRDFGVTLQCGADEKPWRVDC